MNLTAVDQTMLLQGDRTKLKDLLRQRLGAGSWREEIRQICRDAIKERGSNASVDQIVQEITPQARALVPDVVKKELLQKIKTSLAIQEGIE